MRAYPAEKGVEGRPPVLLVHGMSANHYNFDHEERVSLAVALQKKGWDVWVPELRGDPGAVPPRGMSAREATRYGFDDHARKDIPAILEGLQRWTGHKRFAWVGHSMGGMLLYATLREQPEAIAAGVAVAAPATLQRPYPYQQQAGKFAFLMGGGGRISSAALFRLLRPIGPRNMFLRVIANPDNMEWPFGWELAEEALVPLSKTLIRDAARWLKAGELVDEVGKSYLSDATVPMLVMGGTADHLVPWMDVASACKHYQPCRFEKLGKPKYRVDYGHIDALISPSATYEIFPMIEAFLAENTR
ncbi:MAG TPA: alpha/beta fold hydrolase [Myxococcota bacterium]|nr:alpha/beta fold hydrolase [Myxococcota bacterium]